MNYSTLKKTVALSFVAAMGVGFANAQTTSSASGTSTPKVFGGAGQYNTWSIGINVGATSTALLTGGSEDFQDLNIRPAVGLSLRKQVAHQFGIQWDVQYGRVAGNNSTSGPLGREGLKGFQTEFITSSLSGVFNFATIDFLHRENSVNFYATGGLGLASYEPKITQSSTGAPVYFKNPTNTNSHRIFTPSLPIGVGVKFKLSEATALNLGYTETFINSDNFDGLNRGSVSSASSQDHFSYAYGGLEFTLGSSSKKSLEWVNPVALMYDELYDAELRKEVAALKGRVSNVENAVNDLKKDSDGDGVSDQFDKCPNTPAGTVVDGSGCEIHFPTPTAAPTAAPAAVAYSAIQFDFDSSVLRTSSYPVLDATSAELRGGSGSVEVDGFASSEGTAAHNLRLSKDRANSVKTYLVNSGVDAKRIKVKGFGETKPIADNSTEEGRIANRRVEFKR